MSGPYTVYLIYVPVDYAPGTLYGRRAGLHLAYRRSDDTSPTRFGTDYGSDHVVISQTTVASIAGGC